MHPNKLEPSRQMNQVVGSLPSVASQELALMNWMGFPTRGKKIRLIRNCSKLAFVLKM